MKNERECSAQAENRQFRGFMNVINMVLGGYEEKF